MNEQDLMNSPTLQSLITRKRKLTKLDFMKDFVTECIEDMDEETFERFQQRIGENIWNEAFELQYERYKNNYDECSECPFGNNSLECSKRIDEFYGSGQDDTVVYVPSFKDPAPKDTEKFFDFRGYICSLKQIQLHMNDIQKKEDC